MSFNLQKAIWENGPDNPTQRYILLALADYADDNGGRVFPSIETLAAKCCLSPSTAIRAINQLVAGGWVNRKRNRQTSNSYIIQIDKLQPRGYESYDDSISVNMTHINPSDDSISVNLLPDKCQIDTPISVNLTPDPIILTNQGTNHNNASPLDQLRDHFTRSTAVYPNDRTGRYERDWGEPLAKMLELSGGDVDAAAAMIDAALAIAWGKNDSGKTYPVASPRSILTIAVNLAAAGRSAVSAADDDSLWQRALQAVARRDYSDERLKSAIRAIGGSQAVASANGHNTDQLRRKLAHEYRRNPATA